METDCGAWTLAEEEINSLADSENVAVCSVKTKHAWLIFTNCLQFGFCPNQMWQSKPDQSVLIVTAIGPKMSHQFYLTENELYNRRGVTALFHTGLLLSSASSLLHRPSDRDALNCVGFPNPPYKALKSKKMWLHPTQTEQSPLSQEEWSRTIIDQGKQIHEQQLSAGIWNVALSNKGGQSQLHISKNN